MRKQRDSDPVPAHLKKTKAVVDFLKYVIALVIGIAALGWMGHEYIGQFQTTEEAEAAATAVAIERASSHEHVQIAIDENGDAIRNVRIHGVRIELEQRSTNDRLDQLLALQRADTRAERRDAERRVDELQRRIERRERVIRNPVALQRVADQVEDDPLSGLDGL